MRKTIHFKLNGKPKSLALDRERMLLWVLRTDFGLTGAKYGCGAGYCGACTVLVNNEAIRSCQFPVKDVDGKEILTIEGLARNGRLHPLQEAFVKHDALQCGYCTPGMILTAYGLLLKNPRPNPEEITAGMNENLCRCGSYQRVVQAIQDAAQAMKGGLLP
jgi:carbon-monoxide dehydrogenase small subunit